MRKLTSELIAEGHLSEEGINAWREIADLLASLDMIGRDGVSAIFKIDGLRDEGTSYTITLSGPRLGESFFRMDETDLPKLLEAAITYYRKTIWAQPR